MTTQERVTGVFKDIYGLLKNPSKSINDDEYETQYTQKQLKHKRNIIPQ